MIMPMRRSASLMPAETLVEYRGLPLKRESSMPLSAAMMMPRQWATSSAVSAFLVPTEPWVSTLMVTPICSATFSRFSAAM